MASAGSSSSWWPVSLRYFAGTNDGHFFQILPPYIDPKQPPGFTPLQIPTFRKWITDALKLRHIWESPNLVWSVLALLFYFLFPYDLNAKSPSCHCETPVNWGFFQQRFPLWFVLTFGYTLFWYVTLYELGWSRRPMIANRPNSGINYTKLAHDMFYSTSGIAIWVVFENVFVYLWSHNLLAYMPNSSLNSFSGLFWFLLGLELIPLWRDFHFYFSHRFLHYRPVFKQVHSLHHRNTDIEPFSGLSMHPMEHVYYYSCILPNLLLYASPFHLLWNGVHLLLAPGASHSGWEDHFQADNFHYMHHRYFECNYAGLSAAFMDGIFGTFQNKFKEATPKQVEARADAKSTLAGLPSIQHTTYMLLSLACMAVWIILANENARLFEANARTSPWLGNFGALLVCLLAGVGPVLLAYIFTAFSSGFSMQSFLEPYYNRPPWQNCVHMAVGALFSIYPICLGCYIAFIGL